MPYTIKQLYAEFEALMGEMEQVVMRESSVEGPLTEGVAALGGVCEKFTTPGKIGPPDRIITWPADSKGYDWALQDALRQAGVDSRAAAGLHLPVVEFAETKVPGDKPEPWQLRDHVRRRARGHVVHLITGKREVESYLRSRGKQ
jgi:hypothetical protein